MDQDVHVHFSKPIIGAKVYLSRGPSGLSETFQRATADRELELYLGRVTVQIAIEAFIRHMLIERRQDQWSDVIEHLASLTHLEADLVPCDAAISFWAQVNQTRESNAKAKLQAKGN